MSSSYGAAENEAAKLTVELSCCQSFELVPVGPNSNLFDGEESAAQATKKNSDTKLAYGHIHLETPRHSALCNPYQQFTMHPRAILPLYEEINLHNVVSGGGTDDA